MSLKTFQIHCEENSGVKQVGNNEIEIEENLMIAEEVGREEVENENTKSMEYEKEVDVEIKGEKIVKKVWMINGGR